MTINIGLAVVQTIWTGRPPWRNPAKQSASTALVAGIILQKFAVPKTGQDIVHRKALGHHFLMGVKAKRM